MPDHHDWAIHYKFDVGMPVEFYEVRWFKTKVWTAWGHARPWGETEIRKFTNEADTLSGYQNACEAAVKQGYSLFRTGFYYEHGIDHDALTDEIYHGAKLAFTGVRAAHPDQTLTMFGLGSDDEAMTIGPTANSQEEIARNKSDDKIWNRSEWSFFEGGNYLDPAFRMILPPARKIHCKRRQNPRNTVFRSCVDALAQLRNEGFFGAISDDLIVLFQVSDSEQGVALNNRLNTVATYARYHQWCGIQ